MPDSIRQISRKSLEISPSLLCAREKTLLCGFRKAVSHLKYSLDVLAVFWVEPQLLTQ